MTIFIVKLALNGCDCTPDAFTDFDDAVDFAASCLHFRGYDIEEMTYVERENPRQVSDGPDLKEVYFLDKEISAEIIEVELRGGES